MVFSKKSDAGGAEAPAREVKSTSEWDQHLQGSGQEKPIQGKQRRCAGLGGWPDMTCPHMCICVCAMESGKRALRTCFWGRMCPRFQDARGGADTGSVYEEFLVGDEVVSSLAT